jgi:hypothetical protein
MSDFVVVQMWGPYRQTLIDRHLFYVEQARKRLLSQFENIEGDADQAAEEWLKKSGRNFDPDRHDPGDFYESAHEVGIEHYGLLNEMREQTRLSVVASVFHEWDKQLRDWLVREIHNWHHGKGAKTKLWTANFGDIADLLESFGWKLRSADFFRVLDACRLVVNVYKHGDGASLDELKSKYPEYLEDPFRGSGGGFSDAAHRDFSDLKVSDVQLQAFSDAIVAFWKNVPECVQASQATDIPVWFDKAIQKDRAEQQPAKPT